MAGGIMMSLMQQGPSGAWLPPVVCQGVNPSGIEATIILSVICVLVFIIETLIAVNMEDESNHVNLSINI